MDLSCSLALAAALLAGAFIARTRWVWSLGRFGDALAPTFLLILWLCGLHVGQWTGSLRAMAWLAAAPLLLLAARAFPSGLRRRSSSPWTWTDAYLFIMIALLALLFNGEDNLCHYSVISTILRGNIPPSALNDPNSPLAYHWLFDAAAAVFMRASGAGHRLAIGAVSVVCLAACFYSLQVLSRVLFDTERSRQTARLLFAFGFGPIYLRLLELWPHPDKADFYVNGDVAQPFIESILRRPMGLNWAILLFMLGVALKSDSRRKAAWLLPCAYLLPQASEELCLLGTAALFLIGLERRTSWKFFAAWLAILGASLPLSGVARAMFSSHAVVAVPRLAAAWPWTLPDRALALRADGLPLISWKALWTMLTEWGPLFFIGLFAAIKDQRRRPLVWIFKIGFLVACVFTLRGWNKFDLDRFLFYGTALGFMLCAAPLERLGRPAAWTLVALTVLGPVGYAIRSLAINDADQSVSSELIFQRQKDLTAVGPRERVLTDLDMAQDLVLAGFIVDAPMTSHWIGLVDKGSFSSYVKANAKDADWLLARRTDGSYELLRAPK